jgi:hypothetical protein
VGNAVNLLECSTNTFSLEKIIHHNAIVFVQVSCVQKTKVIKMICINLISPVGSDYARSIDDPCFQNNDSVLFIGQSLHLNAICVPMLFLYKLSLCTSLFHNSHALS